jgi:hypothetical protein
MYDIFVAFLAQRFSDRPIMTASYVPARKFNLDNATKFFTPSKIVTNRDNSAVPPHPRISAVVVLSAMLDMHGLDKCLALKAKLLLEQGPVARALHRRPRLFWIQVNMIHRLA